MYIKLQTAYNSWKRVSNLVNNLWNRLYLPVTSSPHLAITYSPLTETRTRNTKSNSTTTAAAATSNTSSTSHTNNKDTAFYREEMPRTRRRHHSRDRSSGGMRDKRRRVDSEENSSIVPDVASPPRYKNTRADAKRRRHDSDASSRVSKESR
uniref:Uncharacterized protein n=1 Tax=Stomoxys calcitrans TaxID=35570 RepID=A0A1I8NYZ8_STOCA